MSLQLMGRDTAVPCPNYHSDATGNDMRAQSNADIHGEPQPGYYGQSLEYDMISIPAAPE